VKPSAEGDYERPARGDLGQLDRGFDRLGSRIGQEQADRLPIGCRAREELRQPFVQLEPRLVVDDVLLGVHHLRRLLCDRGHDARV
jgi:hypothetical protein